MKKILNKLYTLKPLTELESYYIFNLIIKNKITDIEVTAILIAIKMRNISIPEIIGAIKAFQKNTLHFHRPKYKFADIVGTGGDEKNNINISTISAFIASSFGFKIIKHCNQGVSSQLGSANILQKFNININLHPKLSRKILDELNICFLFAPQYHIGFKHVNSVRKILKTKTIFNILGPLLNPSKPKISIIGVYSKKLLLPIAHVLKKLKYERAIIIYSDGTDEITLHHATDIVEIKNNQILSYKLYPEDFGIKKYNKFLFNQNSIIKNYKITKNIFMGYGKIEYEYLIAVNTAILFKIFGYENLKENTKIILEKIRSGNIYKHINNFVQTGL